MANKLRHPGRTQTDINGEKGRRRRSMYLSTTAHWIVCVCALGKLSPNSFLSQRRPDEIAACAGGEMTDSAATPLRDPIDLSGCARSPAWRKAVCQYHIEFSCSLSENKTAMGKVSEAGGYLNSS